MVKPHRRKIQQIAGPEDRLQVPSAIFFFLNRNDNHDEYEMQHMELKRGDCTYFPGLCVLKARKEIQVRRGEVDLRAARERVILRVQVQVRVLLRREEEEALVAIYLIVEVVVRVDVAVRRGVLCACVSREYASCDSLAVAMDVFVS